MTLLRSCCNRAGKSGAFRFAALLLLSAAILFLCAAPRAAADSAPDWLRALAHEKLPD
jgi:hypothetical protein